MTTEYWATSFIPPLVQQALEATVKTGFTKSSLPQVGRMLHLLTAMYPNGRIGELGTGCGVGTAWMASALGSQAHLYSIETNAEQVAVAKSIFTPYPNIHIAHGDWRNLFQYAPFDLLFVDVTEPKQTMPPVLFEFLRIGGTLVIDDMTPEDQKPLDRQGEIDPVRQRLLNGTDLAAFEIFLPPNSAMIIATRRSESVAGTSQLA